MQPTNLNLKAIARDATLRGDTKTLFHALDLLERVVPIATFMDFCTELEELRAARGAPTAALRRSELLRHNQHYLRTMSATLAGQFEGYAEWGRGDPNGATRCHDDPARQISRRACRGSSEGRGRAFRPVPGLRAGSTAVISAKCSSTKGRCRTRRRINRNDRRAI